MGHIIFEKHPGDLIKIHGSKKNEATILIELFTLKVKGLIKLTPQFTFRVNVEFPSNKIVRESLINVLTNWVSSNEILYFDHPYCEN